MVVVDTAGRLHTKTPLMDEIKKVRKTIGKAQDGAPHETLLVLDATTGQNALTQAQMFKEALDLTGIVLTKLDGTAKGGIVLGICDELQIPVRFIGLGERAEDLVRHAARLLAPYKVPSEVIVMPALPAAASGKVLKSRLKALLAERRPA